MFVQENSSTIWCPQGELMPILKRLPPSSSSERPEYGEKFRS
jgi:hypothetical protein